MLLPFRAVIWQSAHEDGLKERNELGFRHAWAESETAESVFELAVCDSFEFERDWGPLSGKRQNPGLGWKTVPAILTAKA